MSSSAPGDDYLARWIVTLTDRSEVNAYVRVGMPEHRAAREAEAVYWPRAFCARPNGCTGLAWNIHFGAEQACPIHSIPTH